MKAFLVQGKAEILRTVRNRRFLIFSVLLPLAFYLFFVKTMGNQKVGRTDFSAYYLISMTAFGVIGGAVQQLSVKYAQERAQGWMSMLKITPLSPLAHYAAKIASQLSVSAFIIVIMFLAGHFVEHVQLSAPIWFESALCLWIGGIPFMSLGLLLGLVAGKSSVQALASAIYLLLSMLGGLWIPVSLFSGAMKTVAYWTPTYRFGDIVWNLIGGGSIAWQDILILVAYLALFMLISISIEKRRGAMNAS